MNAIKAADIACAAMLFFIAVIVAALCDDPDGAQ